MQQIVPPEDDDPTVREDADDTTESVDADERTLNDIIDAYAR